MANPRTGSDDLEFFLGLSWALPTGFRAALAGCRFDIGDVLYDSADAYLKSWGAPGSRLRHSIQVQRCYNATSAGGADTDEAFLNSWSDGIEIALTDHGDGSTRLITSTQGRLYTTLWKGDTAILDSSAYKPEPPSMASAMRSEIPKASQEFASRHSSSFAGGHAFLFAVDHALIQQLLKSRTVEGALRTLGEVEVLTASPAEMRIPGAYRPTILLHSFAIQIDDRKPIEKALKARLYSPAKNRKTDVDRFNLRQHGHLFDLTK